VIEEPQLPDFDSLTLPESSLSDMPLTNNDLFEALGLAPPTDTGDVRAAPAVIPTAAPTTTTTTRPSSSPAPDKRAPIWSEDWDAWIYWDTTLRTWFRHDMQQGTWVPMDES